MIKTLSTISTMLKKCWFLKSQVLFALCTNLHIFSTFGRKILPHAPQKCQMTMLAIMKNLHIHNTSQKSSDNLGIFSFVEIICYRFNLALVNRLRPLQLVLTKGQRPIGETRCRHSPTHSQRSPTCTRLLTTMHFWWNSPKPFMWFGWRISLLKILKLFHILMCPQRRTLIVARRCAIRAVKLLLISWVCSVIATNASVLVQAGMPTIRLSRRHIPNATKATFLSMPSLAWITCSGMATIVTMAVKRATSSSTVSIGSLKPTVATSPTKAKCAAGKPYGRGRWKAGPKCEYIVNHLKIWYTKYNKNQEKEEHHEVLRRRTQLRNPYAAHHRELRGALVRERRYQWRGG